MTPPPAFTVLPRVQLVRPLRREPAGALEPAFCRALHAKLRRLERPERPEPAERPRFVTTVRAGEFLPPPPQQARLLGLEPPVFRYSSRPAAVRARRSAPAPHPPPPLATHNMKGVHALIAGMTRMRNCVKDGNIMTDKRVVRGSTVNAHPHAAGDGVESMAARAARTRRRALARRAAAQRLRPGTPPPAPGRKHHPIQTEYYLEELFEKGVEMEVGVQTDLFVDRPATPIYVPAKTGADVATQIYPGDLFDFDVEVSSIVEVLVGRCGEQALAEAAQEEELAALREQQRRFRELRDAERAERERLAAQDLRLHHEKERRVFEARAAAAAAAEARARAAAAVLAQGYVAELLPAALAGLRRQGYLVERAQRGIDEEFVPWLVEEVSKEIEMLVTCRDLITEVVREVVAARAELHGAAGERAWAAVSPPDAPTPDLAALLEQEQEPYSPEEEV